MICTVLSRWCINQQDNNAEKKMFVQLSVPAQVNIYLFLSFFYILFFKLIITHLVCFDCVTWCVSCWMSHKLWVILYYSDDENEDNDESLDCRDRNLDQVPTRISKTVQHIRLEDNNIKVWVIVLIEYDSFILFRFSAIVNSLHIITPTQLIYPIIK